MDERLGCFGEDIITGFTGVITGKAEYLYGCTQFCIVPRAVDDKIKDAQWFDEGRVKVVGVAFRPSQVVGERPGGPNRDCPK